MSKIAKKARQMDSAEATDLVTALQTNHKGRRALASLIPPSVSVISIAIINSGGVHAGTFGYIITDNKMEWLVTLIAEHKNTRSYKSEPPNNRDSPFGGVLLKWSNHTEAAGWASDLLARIDYDDALNFLRDELDLSVIFTNEGTDTDESDVEIDDSDGVNTKEDKNERTCRKSKKVKKSAVATWMQDNHEDIQEALECKIFDCFHRDNVSCESHVDLRQPTLMTGQQVETLKWQGRHIDILAMIMIDDTNWAY